MSTTRLTLRAFLTACMLALALVVSPSSFGQTETATLSGTITDPSGAVIPGAAVSVTNVETGGTVATTSNASGLYVFASLRPGHYRVVVEKAGFKQMALTDLTLNVQDTLSRNFQMQVGTTSESVTVNGDAITLNTESAVVSTVVDRQFAENLPLNGRSFQTLIALTPGVVFTTATAGGSSLGQFSVNGQHADANYFTVDGVSANFGTSASKTSDQSIAGGTPALSLFGTTNSLVSVDAMQEFRVQTSTYAPEYGRQPGAQVSIVTRSGTNDFHGSLFEYFRNDVLDASDWFNGFTHNPPLPKAAERQNDFGGVFGGPIIRNRTFFFVSYEGLRLRQPQTALTTVPTIAARRGALPAMQPFLNMFPLPNGQDFGNGTAEFDDSFSSQASLNSVSVRVDHTLGRKVALFGRYNYAPSSLVNRGGFSALNNVFSNRLLVQTSTVGATWSVTPRMVNEFRFNYSRASGIGTDHLDTFGGAVVPSDSLLYPAPFTSQNAQFGFVIVGGRQMGVSTGKDGHNLQQQFNAVDNHSIAKGTHGLKVGVDFRRQSVFYDPLSYFSDPVFLNVASAMSGNPLAANFVSARGATIFLHDLGVFAQDAWRALPRLTVTYGIRWDIEFPYSVGDDLQLVKYSGLNNPLTMSAAPTSGSTWNTSYGNFAPRVGLAYKLSQFKDRETELRGGFGLFYDLASQQIFNQANEAFGSFPFAARRLVSGVTFPFSPSVAQPPVIAFALPLPNTVFGYDPNLQQPRTFEWNVALEQSLGSNQKLSTTYVGAAGRHLLQTQVFAGANPAVFSPPGFVFITRSLGTSDYQALQVQFQRRMSGGLQVLASYGLSHSMDTGSTDAVDQSGERAGFAGGASANRGPSSFDIRHSFSAGVTYNLPDPKRNRIAHAIVGNWAIDNIILARSAPPVDVSLPNVSLGGSRVAVRPNIVSGIPLYLFGPQYPGGKRINNTPNQGGPGCTGPFCPSPAGQQGNLGRNALRGFGASQWDFAVRRDFALRERFRIQARAEFFNLLNHPNFGQPSGSLNDPLFGEANQMLGRSLAATNGLGGLSPLYQIGGPRSVQLALKVVF